MSQFLLADGTRVLGALSRDQRSRDLLAKLRARLLRVRVAQLPLGFVRHAGPARPALEGAIAAFVSAALALRTPLDLEVRWGGEGGALQIYERAKPPVNRHPRTGTLSWFSSIHSQSRYLQQRRPVPFSGVAATDVMYGDFGEIEPGALDRLEEVITEQTVR